MLDARNILSGTVALALALSLAGCPDDPHDAETWIDKLDDDTELERALTELARLKDPKSIEPLGETWRDKNHPARILNIIIDIADQFDPEADEWAHVSTAGARRLDPDDKKYLAKANVEDPELRAEIKKKRYEADVRRTYGPHYEDGPYWEKAVPYLQQAVELFLEDDNNDRLIENAKDAVDALGRAKEFGVESDVDVVIRAATVQVPADAKAQVVRITALRALGKWSDNPRASDTLIQVLNAKKEDQHVAVFAAAADALGHAQSKDAIDPLIRAMFEIPVVYPFCRRSLVAIGKPAIKPLLKVFTRKHKKMMAFAKEEKFFAKCKGKKKIGGRYHDVDLGGSPTCKAPKALEVKTANILGDLRAKEAIPAMLAELKERAQPSGWHPETGQPFTNQHQAIFLALRKMGANEKVADALIDYIKDGDSDDSLVAMALDTYSYVTRSTDQLGYFRGIMTGARDRTGGKGEGDPTDPMAVAASLVYSRLADERSHLAPFKGMIEEHKDEADKQEKIFEKRAKAYEELQPKWEKMDEAYKKEIVRPTIEQWEKDHADLKKEKPAEYEKKRDAKPWFDIIKKKHTQRRKDHLEMKEKFEDLEFKKNDAENKMTQARGLQRAAQQNMARILVGVQCKGDAKCLVSFNKKKPAEIAKALEKDIKGATEWDPDQQKLLWIAANERALLELSKLGKKAQPVVDDLLDLLWETERIVREGTLLALPHIAQLPCDKCVAQLDAVIKEQESQTTLAALTGDAKVMRNWFRWAGRQK